MQIILIVVLLGLIGIFLLKKKREGSISSEPVEKMQSKDKKLKNKRNSKKNDVQNKVESPSKDDATNKSSVDQNQALEQPNQIEVQLDEMAISQPVKVSVQEVDPLTEYKVYKEFGYLDKAAEALYGYINSHQIIQPAVLLELANLYLALDKYEHLVDFVLEKKSFLSNEQVAELVKVGLEQDANNLELRVLADELLNWDIETVNTKVLHNDNLTPLETKLDQEQSTKLASEQNISGIQSVSRTASSTDQNDKLVVGQGVLSQVTHEELQVISSMLPNDHAIKLMRTFADYSTFTHKFDRALAKLKNPAAALIDALGLDYQNKNLDAFAHHLWELYNVLGKNGQNIKDKMLGWGYSLGNHEVLNRLAMVTNEQEVRDIGREFGYRSMNKNSSISLTLVSDTVGGGLSRSLGRDVNSILQEADAYLMYGQLDEAMKTLEQGIKLHKNEPQLYVNLFELYERAESWERLEEFSKLMRTDVHDLPEEVVLVMAKLTQKFKNNNIGMVA